MAFLELGPVPCDEECVQVGDANYQDKAYEQCMQYREQLEKQWLDLPDGMRFGIKSFPHDFGRYYEVVIIYQEGQEELAFEIENNLPSKWSK